MHYLNRGLGVSPPAFQGQALAFGEARNQDLSMLRVGIIGCGGTGSAIAQSAVPSAIAMLLPKMDIRNIALFDKDIVEDTNLNRLHGARQPDADAMSPKVEVVAKSLVELGLGVQVRTYQAWIGEADCRDPLKACDVIFGCTDDDAFIYTKRATLAQRESSPLGVGDPPAFSVSPNQAGFFVLIKNFF